MFLKFSRTVEVCFFLRSYVITLPSAKLSEYIVLYVFILLLLYEYIYMYIYIYIYIYIHEEYHIVNNALT